MLQLIRNTLANCHLKPRIVIPNQTDKSSLFPFSLSSVCVRKPKIAVFSPHREVLLIRKDAQHQRFLAFCQGVSAERQIDSYGVCLCVRVCVCV